MSDAEEQQEPTMEEILASIRRIISEDDVEADDSAGETEEAAAEEEAPAVEASDEVEQEEAQPEPEPESEPEPEPVEEEAEEALELTDTVDDDAATESVDEEPEPVAVDPPPGDGLVSDETGLKAAGAFQTLSRTLTSGYDGDEKTLEELVEDILRPILKEWLDANLPEIVDRLVAEEIARLAGKR